MGETKRLNINLHESAYLLLVKLSKQMSADMTYTIRIALGLFFLYAEEAKNGNKIAIVNKEGKMIKEIILPLVELEPKLPD